MQWKPKPKTYIPNGVWHPYFCWLPTDCESGEVVWLGWCERKFEYYREHETYYRVMQPRVEGEQRPTKEMSMSSEVPLLTDEELADANLRGFKNWQAYRQRGGARGQMLMPEDCQSWHEDRAIEQAVRAQWAPEVVARDEEMRVTQGVFRNLQQAANDTAEMLAKKDEDLIRAHAMVERLLIQRDSAQAEAKRLREALQAISSGVIVPPLMTEQAHQMMLWQDAARAALQPGASE